MRGYLLPNDHIDCVRIYMRLCEVLFCEKCLNNCDFNNYLLILILLYVYFNLGKTDMLSRKCFMCLASLALPQQIANSSSPMLELKTAPLSSAMTVFAACVATHVQRSCRSRVPAVFCMDRKLDDQRWLR